MNVPGEMVPRIAVRDVDDAVILLESLRLYAQAMQLDYHRRAAMPGADQFALTAEMVADTRNLCDLIDDIGDSIPTDGTAGADNTEEK